jgi:4,5-DOPA dioxygenase extradiol
MSILFPEVPASAYDAFLPAARESSAAQESWTPSYGRLPALFVSHGAPPVLDDPVWLRELHDWALSMPKPRAVLVVSAHWENAPLAISATDPGVGLFYDFYGFDRRYYELRYDTPDATAFAHQVVGTLAAGQSMHQHAGRGLDHGAFIPLMAMYPLADVPVLQLSMPSLAPYELFGLGQRLRALRDEGVLVVGSGFMTHWLGALRHDPATWGTLTGFNADFDAWAVDALAHGDVDALADFRHRAPGHQHAHPTADHFVPLLLTLGAADSVQGAATAIEGAVFANSKRSFQIA